MNMNGILGTPPRAHTHTHLLQVFITSCQTDDVIEQLVVEMLFTRVDEVTVSPQPHFLSYLNISLFNPSTPSIVSDHLKKKKNPQVHMQPLLEANVKEKLLIRRYWWLDPSV